MLFTIYLLHLYSILSFPFFFFNDTATTEIYTLSLHDALPISAHTAIWKEKLDCRSFHACALAGTDRKSTRLNSSHQIISYAVFCLKKKKNKEKQNNDKRKNRDLAKHMQLQRISTSLIERALEL